METSKTIVISLGGSIVIPDEINAEFLTDFIQLIKGYIQKEFRFVIIVGGGKICRKYQAALTQISDPSREDLDWLGIYTTHLNAEFLRLSFGDCADEKIISDVATLEMHDRPIILAGGHTPGATTDLNAVRVAQKINAHDIINLSNIDFAYDKDPRTYSDAKPIEKISWEEFRKIIPSIEDWGPGNSAPFDPIASKLAEVSDITVAIMNGNNIENLKKYLEGEEFIGTIIS